MRALPRLIALSPGDLGGGSTPRAPFLHALEAALAAGLPGLLLREPALSDRAYLELAADVRLVFERLGAPWFAVHDRAHLAEVLGADAVHLSFRSLRPSELGWLGPGLALGLSTHAHDDPASWGGAHYLFHGPLRATPSKAGRLAPIGLEGLRAAVAAAPCPVLALGGVRAEDVAGALGVGAHGVAVRAGLLGARDPAAATAAFLAALAPAVRE